MMNKKAFELSMGLIVMFIMGVAVLALGLFLVKNFLTTSSELEQQISSSVEMQINTILSSTNEKVVLPEFKKQLKQGQRYIFGLGIKNYIEETADFTITMKFVNAYTTNGEVQYSPNTNIGAWYFEKQGPYTIEKDKSKLVLLPVEVKQGVVGITYVFDVDVICSVNSNLCNPYGYKQKVYVSVIK
jgi:hypothetical protein